MLKILLTKLPICYDLCKCSVTSLIIDLISVDVLVELLVLPPVLVQLILYVLDVLADVVMGLIRRLLEAGQLLLQPLVHLDIIIVIILIIVII